MTEPINWRCGTCKAYGGFWPNHFVCQTPVPFWVEEILNSGTVEYTRETDSADGQGCDCWEAQPEDSTPKPKPIDGRSTVSVDPAMGSLGVYYTPPEVAKAAEEWEAKMKPKYQFVWWGWRWTWPPVGWRSLRGDGLYRWTFWIGPLEIRRWL